MLITVKGIVIRENAFGEKDKFITVLTAEKGKISVVCKGARGSKSGNSSPTQLFSYSEFVLYEKGDKYTLKECVLIESFFSLRKNLADFSLGQYFLDIANEVSTEEEDNKGILRCLLNSLFLLSKEEKDRKKIKAVYELRIAGEIGLSPDVSGCSVCGCEPVGTVYFDLINGNFKCEKCFHSMTDVRSFSSEPQGVIIQLTPNEVAALRYVLTSKLEKMFSFSLSADSAELFSRLCEKYIINQLGRSFSTLDFYYEIS